MKNILLLVHDDEGQEARLQAALDLTRALDGHLTCVDVAVTPVLTGDFLAGAAETALLARQRVREDDNRTRLEPRLANEGVRWDWIESEGALSDAVVDAAMLTDLIVLNHRLESGAFAGAGDLASRVVMRARKPVVAAPQMLRRWSLGRALVAWDGQTSSAATMRACVPLLALAQEVAIFTVRDGSDMTDPNEAAEYLSRHGIRATVNIVEDGIQAPDWHIRQESARWRADYVMMGAYGRGRLMETFGGVTKRMLGESDVPLVLGH